MIPHVISWFLYVTHLLNKQSHTLKEVFFFFFVFFKLAWICLISFTCLAREKKYIVNKMKFIIGNNMIKKRTYPHLE